MKLTEFAAKINLMKGTPNIQDYDVLITCTKELPVTKQPIDCDFDIVVDDRANVIWFITK